MIIHKINVCFGGKKIEFTKNIITLIAFILIFILESMYPLFKKENFKDPKLRTIHGIRNLAIPALNGIIVLLFFATPTLAAFSLIESYHLGLLNIIPLPIALRLFFMIILFDWWMYTWHKLNHRYLFLWKFHRMHHTDPAMDVTSALRFHPGEIMFSSTLRIPIYIIIGMTASDLLIYETLMLPIILFHHSNIYIPKSLDAKLRTVIVTPWMHWVHHSQYQPETDSNFGVIFSFWDRFYSTLRIKENPQEIVYGLKKYTDVKWHTFIGMLRTGL